MLKSIVLLSGGLDSTVNLRQASSESAVALALTFDYGQRAAACEIERSREMCRKLAIPHRVEALPWLADITVTALVNEERPLPDIGNLDDPAEGQRTAEAVWVPNRNGLFINIAGAFAEAAGASMIVVGFNAEEASTFPDNSPEFISIANRFLSFSTLSRPKVVSYTANLDKTGVVRMARDIGAPLELTWPCYGPGPELCTCCESCRRFFRALDEAGERDWFDEARPKHEP